MCSIRCRLYFHLKEVHLLMKTRNVLSSQESTVLTIYANAATIIQGAIHFYFVWYCG
jgi:hypothetical protein